MYTQANFTRIADITSLNSHDGGSRLHPFLRSAAMAFVPRIRDDQVQRISDQMHAKYPSVLVSRVNEQVVLVQGIAVKAECCQDADAVTWERMQIRAHL